MPTEQTSNPNGDDHQARNMSPNIGESNPGEPNDASMNEANDSVPTVTQES